MPPERAHCKGHGITFVFFLPKKASPTLTDEEYQPNPNSGTVYNIMLTFGDGYSFAVLILSVLKFKQSVYFAFTSQVRGSPPT